MGCRIDFALQNLFRTGDGESRHFVTESFTGTKHFLRCFRLGGSNDGISFDLSLLFGALNNLGSALFAASISRPLASAAARATLLLSAAARPSAIFFWRSSIAWIKGGQMYFIVIQHPMKNTSICTNSVALMFIMGTPLRQCRAA